MKPAPSHLTCRELVELVTDYLEGKLPRDERSRLEQHLCLCDGCVAYLEQMRALLRATGQLTEEAVAPEAEEKLLAVFRKWKGGDL